MYFALYTIRVYRRQYPGHSRKRPQNSRLGLRLESIYYKEFFMFIFNLPHFIQLSFTPSPLIPQSGPEVHESGGNAVVQKSRAAAWGH